jgi:hypothetical protein
MSQALNVACAMPLRLIKRHTMKVHGAVKVVQLHAFLISAQDGGQVQLIATRKAAPGNWTSGLVDYTGGLQDAGHRKACVFSLMFC